MKYFHVNKGLGYAQPYESDYAILRRCLVANPGITLSALKINIRGHYNVDIYDYARNNNHDRDIYPYTMKYPEWQCPECAKVLYHTNIYHLPWLLKCPIHHVVFTRVCPTCHQWWPTINELKKRDCPTCGVTPLKTIYSQVLPGLKTMDYQPVEKIYTFIHGHETRTEDTHDGYFYREQFDLNASWCNQVSYHDFQYPSFRKHDVNGYTDNILGALHIQHSHVQYKCFKIIGRKILDHEMERPYSNPGLCLRWFYKTMLEIIEWINHHTPKSHTVHLADYRELDLYRIIVDRSHLCPYCSAFSLWFYYYMTDFYNNGHPPWRSRRTWFPRFPFMYESCFIGFHDLGEPFLKLDDGSAFRLQNSFNRWFNQRGLTISFLHILRHLFQLTEKINISLKKRGCYLYMDHEITYKGIPDEELLSYDIKNDKLVFLYMIDDPLREYRPPKTTGIARICKVYHDEIESHYGIKCRGYHGDEFNGTFSQYKFNKLVDRFYKINLGLDEHDLRDRF